MTSGRSDVYDVELVYHYETERAYKVSEGGDEGAAVWLPKSQVECDEPDPGVGQVIGFAVPAWLLEEKGLA